MGKRLRIKPTQIKAHSSYIKPTEADSSIPVSFNFKNMKEKGEKFTFNAQPSQYFKKFLERLSSISTMNKQEMIVNNRDSLRCHRIDFHDEGISETTFGLAPDLDDDAWQFQISSNAHGRVHGYFVSSVFYIIWLDPEHELYPNQKN